MASENIGELYPTKIPGYDDAADIQAALRLYHYGSTSYDINNNVIASLPNPSMAYTLNNLQEQITENYNSPAAAAEVQDTEPVSPVDGFLWVHTDDEYTGLPLSATSIYQNATPTSGLIDGLLWIKKGTSPLEMSVYDADTSAFIRVI
jgi:hypothetical protein